MTVKSELQNLGIFSTVIELGEVETTEEISSKKLLEFKLALQRFGLELMEDYKRSLRVRLFVYPLSINPVTYFQNHVTLLWLMQKTFMHTIPTQ